MATLFTFGLSEIHFAGTKVGMTYKDTCKLVQDKPDVTEHYEEGKANAAIINKVNKAPKLTFSIMNPDTLFLSKHLGGTHDLPTKKWSFDPSAVVAPGEWEVVSKKGMDFSIKKGDAVAVINFDISDKGLLLVEFEVTPLDPGDGKSPFTATEKP